jgi:MarR family transcriptional regulator, transcriptional regulator for hemolysin
VAARSAFDLVSFETLSIMRPNLGSPKANTRSSSQQLTPVETASPQAPSGVLTHVAGRMNKKVTFGILVHEVSRIRRKAIDHVLEPMGITGGQWWVVTYISLHLGLSQVVLADELNIGKVALGGLVDRLEKAGLIERRPDRVDRRMNRIYLSKRGIRLVKDIKRASEDVQDKALDGITSEELKHAISALEKMESNLREFVKKRGPTGRREFRAIPKN